MALQFFWTTLVIIAPAWIVSSPIDRFFYTLAVNLPNRMLRNSNSCSFVSFSVVPFTKKADYLRDVAIFMISLISLLELISIVTPNP